MGRDGIAAETGRGGRTSMHGDQSCFARLDLAEAKTERNMEREGNEKERERDECAYTSRMVSRSILNAGAYSLRLLEGMQ